MSRTELDLQAQRAYEEEKASAEKRRAEEVAQLLGTGRHTARVKKKFGKHTDTWKLFEILFFQDESNYPLQQTGLSRGQAINLTQGLNRCNIQLAEEQGMPDEAIMFSAKAKEAPDGTWLVEVSKNWKRAGELPPSRQGGAQPWLAEMLERNKVEMENGVQPSAEADWAEREEKRRRERDAKLYGVGQVEAAAPAPTPPIPSSPDAQEDLLSLLYGKDGE